MIFIKIEESLWDSILMVQAVILGEYHHSWDTATARLFRSGWSSRMRGGYRLAYKWRPRTTYSLSLDDFLGRGRRLNSNHLDCLIWGWRAFYWVSFSSRYKFTPFNEFDFQTTNSKSATLITGLVNWIQLPSRLVRPGGGLRRFLYKDSSWLSARSRWRGAHRSQRRPRNCLNCSLNPVFLNTPIWTLLYNYCLPRLNLTH